MAEPAERPETFDRVVAIDLGGTFTKIAVADAEGGLDHETEVPTVLGPGGEVTTDWLGEQIRSFAGQFQDHYRVRGFGVAVPGVIDVVTGTVRTASNIDWHQMPLRERLIASSGLPGQIGHDVRSGGIAEWRLGSGVGARNLVFLPLGTGIAAALVVDGRMLEGDGYAGEIGHSWVSAAEGMQCACGANGCLEIIAGAAGVARTYARLSGESIETKAVAGLARQGDANALEAFALASAGLVEALRTTIMLLGPEVIVIGGGLAGAADLLFPALEGISESLSFQRMPKIVKATFGSRAGVIGAGVIGWDAVRASRSSQ